jgi:lipoyl(octanoyl) transferase
LSALSFSAAVSKSFPDTLRILRRGCIPYQEAYTLQEALHARRLRGEIPDTLLLLEHPPVFTTGRQDVAADWRLARSDIRARGIDIVFTNRGGRITYHGPGQLVGYFICDLRACHMGVADFVHWMVNGLIAVVSRY